MIRSLLANYYRKRLLGRREMNLQAGRKSIVFAPHPDDETLGCAGLIARKVRAGEDVYLVVMTDGSRSHSHLIESDRLIAMRARELRNAAEILGVRQDRIFFLGYEDGKLADNMADAEKKVSAIVRELVPDEVYTTYKHDLPADHRATNQIVCACARNYTDLKVYEYPIWFYAQWPFIVPELRGRSEIPKKMIETLVSNKRLLSDMDCAININDVLNIKQEAINAYESQTIRYNNDKRWSILADISNGEFLGCFLAGFEVFYRSQ